MPWILYPMVTGFAPLVPLRAVAQPWSPLLGPLVFVLLPSVLSVASEKMNGTLSFPVVYTIPSATRTLIFSPALKVLHCADFSPKTRQRNYANSYICAIGGARLCNSLLHNFLQFPPPFVLCFFPPVLVGQESKGLRPALAAADWYIQEEPIGHLGVRPASRLEVRRGPFAHMTGGFLGRPWCLEALAPPDVTEIPLCLVWIYHTSIIFLSKANQPKDPSHESCWLRGR